MSAPLKASPVQSLSAVNGTVLRNMYAPTWAQKPVTYKIVTSIELAARAENASRAASK